MIEPAWIKNALASGAEKRRHATFWSDHGIVSWSQAYEKKGHHQFRASSKTQIAGDLGARARQISKQDSPGRILEAGSQAVRSVFDIHNLDPDFLRAALPTELFDIARLILNSRPVIYQSHLNFKEAGKGEGYDWHSDFCFWRHHDGMLEPRAISVLIAIDEHRPGNGGLKLVDGSHQVYYPTRLRKRSEAWKKDEVKHGPDGLRLENGLIEENLISAVPEDCISQASMSPGDFLVMDANTWHSSGANLSQNNRTTLFLILAAEETAFDESYFGYRPAYITCRKKVPLDSI